MLHCLHRLSEFCPAKPNATHEIPRVDLSYNCTLECLKTNKDYWEWEKENKWHSAYPLGVHDIPRWVSYISPTISNLKSTTSIGKHTTIEIYESIISGEREVYTTCDGVPRVRNLQSHPIPSTQPALKTTWITVTHEHWDQGPHWMRKPLDTLANAPNGFCGPWDFGGNAATDNIHADPRACSEHTASMSYWFDQDNFDIAPNMPFPCALGFCGAHLESPEIVLLYWPSEGSVEGQCRPEGVLDTPVTMTNETVLRTFSTSAITFRGQELYLRTVISIQPDGVRTEIQSEKGYIRPSVLRGPFTFTSPTIYIAHHSMFVVGFKSEFQEFPPGIITADASDIMTGPRYRHIASQILNGTVTVGTTSFTSRIWDDAGKLHISTFWKSIKPDMDFGQANFNDFQNPVPADVYFAARKDCWGKQTHCLTITDDSYQPDIYLRKRLWKKFLFPNLPCNLPGLIDPPIRMSVIGDHTLPPASLPFATSTVNEALQVTEAAARPGNGLEGVVPRPTSASTQNIEIGGLPQNTDEPGSVAQQPNIRWPWYFMKPENNRGSSPAGGWPIGSRRPESNVQQPSIPWPWYYMKPENNGGSSSSGWRLGNDPQEGWSWWPWRHKRPVEEQPFDPSGMPKKTDSAVQPTTTAEPAKTTNKGSGSIGSIQRGAATRRGIESVFLVAAAFICINV